ncbi:hypothetical protein [Myxococcus phage Mx1]|nr:hypothetical protein [Myxococcus phage Mx1]
MIRTSSKGIFQSDILIRTAVVQGLEELRRKPWLVDYVMAWLISDDLTRSQYGEEELQKAKSWLLNNNVTVSMSTRIDVPEMPCIGIELVDSAEQNATLGDIHYSPTEQIDASEILINPQVVVGPFTPSSYSSETGVIVLPSGSSTANVFPGMVLFDVSTSKGHYIKTIESSNSFTIATGVKANFTRAYIAPHTSFMVMQLRSRIFRESYRLRCFVPGNAVNLSILHGALTFLLLRNTEELLEARGFEASSLTSGPIGYQPPNDAGEFVYTRDVTITGWVRQYWPHGDPMPAIDGIHILGLRIMDSGSSPEGIRSEVESQGWELEGDGLSFRK